MITSKLIIQSFLGLGAIAGVAGGGYMMMGNSESSKEYFLVTSVATDSNTNKADEELWTKPKQTKTPLLTVFNVTSLVSGVQAPTTETDNNKTQKNYQCQITTKKDHFDKDCELISIDFHQTNKTAYLSTELKNIKESKKPKKDDLTAKKFFLLKIVGSEYGELMKSKEANKTIELLSNTKTDAETTYKSYAKLTVHAKVTKNSVEGKTDLAIVKATKNTATVNATGITVSTYKCKFQNEDDTNAKECFVTEITEPSADKKLENLNLSSFAIPTTQTTTLDAIKDKYYAIKWTDKVDISSLNNNIVVFFEESTVGSTNNKKTSEFKVESFAFAHEETNNNLFFILK